MEGYGSSLRGRNLAKRKRRRFVMKLKREKGGARDLGRGGGV